MTTRRRYQLACAATACTLAVFGLWCARQGQWLPTFALGFGAMFFVDLSLRERRASVRPPAARNGPARPTDPNDPENAPCCPVNARFGATSHDTHCARKDRAA
ncbi:hypothetical protein U9R90_05350 [Streptomyces sp. E11-3]|uniref:hypothetical protein n=1 Tax=Streptomyces sp. E11-3 TaxID=3110112 RepID=UPI00397F1AD2